jgi:UMP-CMP kinase
MARPLMTSKPLVAFILGGPCSGKGTQGLLLQERLGYMHISAGHLLREECKLPDSKYKEFIEESFVSGKIVPSFITVALLQTEIGRGEPHTHKFLVDGFPRNFENLISWNETTNGKVVTPFLLSLTCSQSTMIKRLKLRSQTSNRCDDNEEVMQKRIAIYHESTLPVIEWFRKTDRVIDVDTEGTPE